MIGVVKVPVQARGKKSEGNCLNLQGKISFFLRTIGEN